MSKFLKSFLCIFACVFLCVASFFTGYFFRDTVRINQNETVSSLCTLKSADSTEVDYSYTGSNISFLVSGFISEDISIINMRFIDFLTFSFFVNQNTIGFSNFTSFGVSSTLSYSVSSFSRDEWHGHFFEYFNSDGDSYFIPFGHMMQSNFNFNIVSIFLGHGYNYFGSDNFYTQVVRFYDINGYYLQFDFAVSRVDLINSDYSNLESVLMNNRVYYLSRDFSDNEFYDQGYSAGYDFGRNDGYSSGYDIGYNSGFQDGETYGYNNGLNTTDTYSFANLLTAVVEAPVNVFISLLDFNIMGYNLLSLVVGLLSLAVIVVIIKLCLGGK